MRPEDAIATLQQAGSQAARNRDRRANEAERAGLELGAIGNLLKANYGQSQSKTAAKLGIPQTTLSGWMVKAAEAGYTVEDPIYRALVLGHGRIGQHVADNNIHIDRIVTTRGDTQMLAMTDLPIDAFSDGRHVNVPSMMVHNADTGEWIGVDNVLPGAYGGTGPSNVYRAAEELGLDEDLAREIAFTDYCSDVDVFNGTATHPKINTSAYPHPLPNPHPDNPAVFVQDFACNALDEWVHGRDDKSTTLSYAIYLRSWLKFFTHPEPPSWAQGPLRARIYIAPEAAAADGFDRPGWYGSDAVCQLILERGRTQLWLSLRQPHDPARWVSDEAYDLLAAIDQFPKEFEAEKDAPSMLRRWIRARTPERVRPPYLDVGPGGEPDRHGLDFIPARHKTTQ